MATDVLAAQTILKDLAMIIYMIPSGLSLSTKILVGNYIGASKIKQVQFYTKLGLTLGFIWSIFSVLLINIFKNPLISIFTT
jgi:MATE family multidrug resistance protein